MKNILVASLFVFLVFCSAGAIGQEKVWQLQETGVKASLRGLCVVSKSVVWASGTEGTVLKTVNGGSRWQNVSVNDAGSLDFRDIHAFDNKRAVVLSAGQPACIYLTEDGGRSWKKTFEHPDEKSFFDAISFWDRNCGIAMSDPIGGRILLIQTTDGGKSWKELDEASRPRSENGEGGFAASGTNMIIVEDRCWIALGSAEPEKQFPTSRILFSDDRGQSWNSSTVPMPRNSSSGIFSLAFADKSKGVAVGGNYQKPEVTTSNVAITSDGGITWSKPNGTPPNGYRSCVVFASDQNKNFLIAVGPDGTDVSQDGGENWKLASKTGFHAVAFTPEKKHGWASGSDGRIGKWNELK